MPGEDPKFESYPEREPLPEERAAGIDDPDAQAKAILDEAAERTALPRSAPGVERRASEDTVDLTDGIDSGSTPAVVVSETGAPEGA